MIPRTESLTIGTALTPATTESCLFPEAYRLTQEELVGLRENPFEFLFLFSSQLIPGQLQQNPCCQYRERNGYLSFLTWNYLVYVGIRLSRNRSVSGECCGTAHVE